MAKTLIDGVREMITQYEEHTGRRPGDEWGILVDDLAYQLLMDETKEMAALASRSEEVPSGAAGRLYGIPIYQAAQLVKALDDRHVPGTVLLIPPELRRKCGFI